MNIGIVINTSWNIFNFRQGLIKALLLDGHTLFAIAPKDEYSSKLAELGVKVIPVKIDSKGLNPIKDLKLIYDLRKIYKNQKLDCVLQFTIKPNIYGTIAAVLLQTKVINNVSGLGTIFIRENLLSSLVRRMYKWSFKKSFHVFFQNSDDIHLFLQKKLIKKKKCSLLPGSGIPLDLINYTPKEYSENRRSFFMPSRLLIDKGVKEYVEAAIKLKAEFGTRVDCFLCGKPEENKKLGFGLLEANEWTEKGFLNYLGHIDNTLDWMSKSDIVVLPSYREGTPRSLLEAASLGRPIITTDAPGCREIVQNTRNGLLCAVKDSNSLYNCMREMVLADNLKLSAMGKESRSIVEEKYDENIVIRKYRKQLKKINRWI